MVQVQGQNSNRNTVKQMAKMSKISRVTTTRPVLRHWCRRQEFEAEEWFWIQPGIIGSTMAGRLRSDFDWSWTFRIACVTLHDCEVAPLRSQTLARAIFFFAICLTVFPFEFLPRIFTIKLCEKNLSDQSLWFWIHVFSVCVCVCVCVGGGGGGVQGQGWGYTWMFFFFAARWATSKWLIGFSFLSQTSQMPPPPPKKKHFWMNYSLYSSTVIWCRHCID